MKKLVIILLFFIVHNLNGKEFKIKGDYLYIKGNVQISKTEYFNDSDYNSIEIFAYYKAHSDDLVPKIKDAQKYGTNYQALEERIKAETPSTVGAVHMSDGYIHIVIDKTTVDQGGQYNLKIKTEELILYRFMTKKRRINSENINIKIKSPKYSSNDYSFTNEKLIKKNTFELSPFVLNIREDWMNKRLFTNKINNLKYNVNKMTGPYDADGFTDFFADGNNYFLWNTKDSKRGMYRSVDSGENWERMTWDGIQYIPYKVYKYDDKYLFQYTTEDNPDGVWNLYDYDKKVWSVYEIDEFELKIFNAEKDNWEKEFNSQKSKKYPITNTRRGVYYKDYKYNILLPYNKWIRLHSREREKYRDGKIKPLLNGTIYEREDHVFVLNTYGLFKLMTESEIESSSNYNKMIYDNFVECKSFFESELKSQLKLEEIIKKYKETKNTVEERKIIHKDLKQELKKEYDWLNKMKGWEEDATLVEEKRKEIEIEYKKRLNKYNELDYNVNELNDYLQNAEKWLSSKKVEIDSLKKLITDEVRSFPMFYPVPVNGINPSEISDVRTKNDALYVLTSLNNGWENKLFLYDGKWHTIFDPFINDLLSESQQLSIEMLDNIDDIIFISPSSKSSFPNNIYYLNHTQDNAIENNENKYELLPYRDKTGRSIEHAYTDKSGKLWTIEKNKNVSRSACMTCPTYTFFQEYQLYRYKSLSDLSDPLLIQEWKTFYVDKDNKGKGYDPETRIPSTGRSRQSRISPIKLIKTENSIIHFIKDNTIKQIGSGRDKDFISRHNILTSFKKIKKINEYSQNTADSETVKALKTLMSKYMEAKSEEEKKLLMESMHQVRKQNSPPERPVAFEIPGEFAHMAENGVKTTINDSIANYTYFPYKNDIVMFNYFDHFSRENYADLPQLTNFFHIQRGINKGVNQNDSPAPNFLINQFNGLGKYSRGDYRFDQIGTLIKLLEIRKKNGFVDEEFHIDSELRNGYNKHGYTGWYKHEGGRGTYKIRCSIGNNGEILIYNYPTGIYYLKDGDMTDMKPFDYFDKMKVSEITNDKDGYLIGTYSSGLYKVSIVTN